MKKILDVGQCDADHSRITDMLRRNFKVEIDRAHSIDETKTLAGNNSYDLVLINRLLDADGSAGMDVLAALKSSGSEAPAMIVSNFDEAQQAAVAAGARPGFGQISGGRKRNG